MPKYMMVIVESEAAYAEAGEAAFASVMAEHNAFVDEVAKAGGTILDGEALQPSATATYLRGHPDAGGAHHRQPAARAQGNGRRLLPGRGRRRRGCLGARQALPGRLRLRRAAPGLGIRRLDGRPMISVVVAEAAARAQRELSGRVLAVTLRSVRDLDIAEEATADAFLLALQTWPERGVPASVEAWLITAARRRAIDRIRSAQAARRALIRQTGDLRSAIAAADDGHEIGVIGDEDLRMVVLCCDPRIAVTDQVALTLRLACGVPTAAIAAAFLTAEPTMAARLTRAKKRLAAAGPALDLPDDATVDARLPAVREVVYLAFTLGHTAAAGSDLTDEELADRAQYLALALSLLRPADPEFRGLLALILLTRARSGGRIDDDGSQVLLAEVDRSRWDRAMIDQGMTLAPGGAGAAPGTAARADGAAGRDRCRARAGARLRRDQLVGGGRPVLRAADRPAVADPGHRSVRRHREPARTGRRTG